MAKPTNIAVDAELAARLQPHAEALGWSSRKFALQCIEIICDMIEKPEARVLPKVVVMLDADKITPIPLLPATKYPQGTVGLRAAEDPATAEAPPTRALPRRASGK